MWGVRLFFWGGRGSKAGQLVASSFGQGFFCPLGKKRPYHAPNKEIPKRQHTINAFFFLLSLCWTKKCYYLSVFFHFRRLVFDQSSAVHPISEPRGGVGTLSVTDGGARKSLCLILDRLMQRLLSTIIFSKILRLRCQFECLCKIHKILFFTYKYELWN